MTELTWNKTAETMISAGLIPMAVTGTMIELLQTIMDEEEARFVHIFDKPSLNMEEIGQRCGLDADSLEARLDGLLRKGVLMVTTSSRGIQVYTLMPPFPGLFELTLVRGETGEKQKRLAVLFDRLFAETAEIVRDNYDDVVDLLRTVPPMTRVVPVECEIDTKLDSVMPYEDAMKIVDKFDTIALSHCYCRHQKDLLGRPCKATDVKENCMSFGRAARFMIDYEFGRTISRDEAKRILRESEEAGLVHKFLHEKHNLDRDEYAICNCCKCCCGTFEIYYRGAAPMQTYATHLARVDDELCDGCGVCVEMCAIEAVELAGDRARVNEDRCMGCGICAYHCPAGAATLERTGMREVFIPPRSSA